MSKRVATSCIILLGFLVLSFPLRRATGLRLGLLDDAYLYAIFVSMGFYALLLVFTLMGHLFALLATRATPEPLREQRRRFLNKTLQGTAALASAGLGTAAFVNARRGPKVIKSVIFIDDLHPDLEGFKIAQLSDVHVGPTIRAPFIEPIVEKTNALDADLIALTGDVVDGSVEELREHVAPLTSLKSKHGVYFCTGNHEYYSGALPWCAHFESLGMNVLLNEHKILRHKNAELLVGGVTDLKAERVLAEHKTDPSAVLKNAPQNDFKLLLAHQPRSALAAAPLGFDLQLSGHTHGGQFFPFNFLIHVFQPFVAGLYKHKSMWVYVNRGTTYWGPPFRLGPPSEISLLILKRTPTAKA